MKDVGNTSVVGGLVSDPQGIGALRAQAQRDPKQALKNAAQEFEALFVNMLLKSMRDASPQDGLLSGSESKIYTSMLDQQLSRSVKGMGIADALTRQLSRFMPPDGDAPAAGKSDQPAMAPSAPALKRVVPSTGVPSGQPPSGQQPLGGGAAPTRNAPEGVADQPQRAPGIKEHFTRKLWSEAQAAAEGTGIPARFLLGQAALESGWGRKEMRMPDGSLSHNVFGIKAGRNWQGPTVDKPTTEYVNGQPHKVTQSFRAYASYQEAFEDYARLIKNNPRYAGVVAQSQDATAFARGLQRAGYATDPLYAAKLARVIQSSPPDDASMV